MKLKIDAAHLLCLWLLSTMLFSLNACSLGISHNVYSPNRLQKAKSAYLLAHAGDPVDWYPWGQEAFQKAKRENKPIFLSIGFSTCHWCHVMHRESFQNTEIAKILNKDFVSVLVDSEERPDIDDTYMKASQLISGSGGWPLTLFLDTQSRPFFAGTYFKPNELKNLLSRTASAWHSDNIIIERLAGEISQRMLSDENVKLPHEALSVSIINRAINRIHSNLDQTYGGLGNQAKFPLPCLLALCIDMDNANTPISPAARLKARQIYNQTLDAMEAGGIHDHVGGGFFRYTVDRKWRTPHFEKMLYLNALLAEVYLNGYQVTGKPSWLAAAKDTINFSLGELLDPEGYFYAGLDADTSSGEGAYYSFSSQEINGALGADAAWFAGVYTEPYPKTENNRPMVLHRSDQIPEQSTKDKASRAHALLGKLYAIRAQRPAPAKDKKVITSWNALMISALVKAYKVSADPQYLMTARRCALYILSTIKNGKLQHDCSPGQSVNEAYLDDYSYMAQALLDLADADNDQHWIRNAIALNEKTMSLFYDRKENCFYYSAREQQSPLFRPRITLDEATPAPGAIAILNLLRLERHCPSQTQAYLKEAQRALPSQLSSAETNPTFCAAALIALRRYLAVETSLKAAAAGPD